MKNHDLKGNFSVLEAAFNLLDKHTSNHEKHPAVKYLCDWWNVNAPEEMRHAAFFHSYFWDKWADIFIPEDIFGPKFSTEKMSKISSHAIFQRENEKFALIFFRGKEFNKRLPVGNGLFFTQLYFANGDVCTDLCCDEGDVDDCLISFFGFECGLGYLRQCLY
ncbi:hypothetical protein HZU77_014190 [Neisseriaceae bacterium TC5R-5]|nr:hypothetical protein [Neisseriaceae bacterium TC5R-5]